MPEDAPKGKPKDDKNDPPAEVAVSDVRFAVKHPSDWCALVYKNMVSVSRQCTERVRSMYYILTKPTSVLVESLWNQDERYHQSVQPARTTRAGNTSASSIYQRPGGLRRWKGVGMVVLFVEVSTTYLLLPTA